jgi:hypothetical protein
VNGYSQPQLEYNNAVAHYRYAMGFTGDDTRYSYIFGGYVSPSGLDSGYIAGE